MKTLRFIIFSVMTVLLLIPTSSTTAQPPGSFSAGDLDPEFGEAGKLIVPLDFSDVNYVRLVIQPDGKLLLAANVEDTTAGFATVRLLPDGSPDPSFGGDGRVDASFAEGQFIIGALILQPDGKILVVGTVHPFFSQGIGMARFLPDGNPDTSFGEGGKVHVTYGRAITGSAAGLLPDGKILVSGMVRNDETINSFDIGIHLARFSPDGSLDSTFDQDGLVVDLFKDSNADGEAGVGDLAVLPDGKIVVVGTQGNEEDTGWLIRRFNADGSFDASIPRPTHGDCLACFDTAFAVGVQPDGKLLVAGVQSIRIITEVEEFVTNYFAVLRFNPDDSLDESFGEGGTVLTNFPPSDQAVAYDIVLQEDGKIIALGEDTGNFALARYHPDGSLDESFGEAGLVITDFGAFELGLAAALQTDGKIVAAGSSFRGASTPEGLAVARYFAGSEDQRMEVIIDILPGSSSNVIYLRGPGIIPVAVLSTPDFDATSMVDKTSLTFGRTGDEHSLILCFKRGVDVNRDKNPDLFCFFRTRATGFQVGDTEGILKGQTQDGAAIQGRDEVEIRKGKHIPKD